MLSPKWNSSLFHNQVLSGEFKADMAFKCHLCKKVYMNNIEFMKHLSLHVETDRASAVDLVKNIFILISHLSYFIYLKSDVQFSWLMRCLCFSRPTYASASTATKSSTRHTPCNHIWKRFISKRDPNSCAGADFFYRFRLLVTIKITQLAIF